MTVTPTTDPTGNGGRASAPLFSVLVPSRDRVELLKHAIASVQRQDFDDLEIIVSDNASSEDYTTELEALAEPRLRYIRTPRPVSVTDNWNHALRAARGRYIIVIGDDDALAPSYLTRAAELIERFSNPDAIYSSAYYYAYPRVFPTAPKGFLAMIKPLALQATATTPHLQDIAEARRLGAQALKFRHRFAFNAQYFIWSRAFIDRLAAHGPFFQSPFPDFYAAFTTMLAAQSIVVSPDPGVIIGVTLQSFGFHLHNDDLGSGDDLLMIKGGFEDGLRDVSAAAKDALAFPGSSYFRHWLMAALYAAKNLGIEIDRALDFRRYRRVQLFDLAYRRGFHRRLDLTPPARIDARERALFEHMTWAFMAMRRARSFGALSSREQLFVLLQVYQDALVIHYDLQEHEHISDAWQWLATSNSGSFALPFLDVDPARQVIDVFKLEKMLGDMGSALSSKDIHIGKLDVLMRGKDAQINALTEMVRTRERVFASPGRLLWRGLLLTIRNLRRSILGRT